METAPHTAHRGVRASTRFCVFHGKRIPSPLPSIGRLIQAVDGAAARASLKMRDIRRARSVQESQGCQGDSEAVGRFVVEGRGPAQAADAMPVRLRCDPTPVPAMFPVKPRLSTRPSPGTYRVSTSPGETVGNSAHERTSSGHLIHTHSPQTLSTGIIHRIPPQLTLRRQGSEHASSSVSRITSHRTDSPEHFPSP